MSLWDSAAAERLERVVADLRAAEVVEVFRDLTREVWRTNLSRYEPSELGDTVQWLGFSSWVNLSQLTFRHYAGREQGHESEVSAYWRDQSLLVEACDVRLQMVKSSPSSSRLPMWSSFTWSAADSQIRRRAAQRNSAAYLPTASDQDGRAPTLGQGNEPTLWGAPSDLAELRDVMLVWSGDPTNGLTAGWLGFPSIGVPPWFAIAPLWWDEHDERSDASSCPISPDDKGTFSDRPEPALNLGLRKGSTEQAGG